MARQDGIQFDRRTDREIDGPLAALYELCGLMLACRRNGGRRTAHVFGVRFDQAEDELAATLLKVAKKEGFAVDVAPQHPGTLTLSC